jgi:hypothetical protein
MRRGRKRAETDAERRRRVRRIERQIDEFLCQERERWLSERRRSFAYPA